MRRTSGGRSAALFVAAVAAVAVSACTGQDSSVTAGSAAPPAESTTPNVSVEAGDTTPDTTTSDTTTSDTTTETTPPDSQPPTDLPSEFTADPELRTGTLANGLRYYIRANDRPGAQAELRMAINAGSVLEDPDQSAVAHFLEHMLFNGTAKYPKNELIAELQKQGSEFGADVNAYTSYDETVYELTVKNDAKGLATGLDILHEWLTAATIAESEVKSERGVVLDEYRTRELTSNGRIFTALEKSYFAGTKYEGRAPIGTSDAIQSMTSEKLRRFYDTWYRPDNAAIVVVGEIDVDKIERQITDVFGSAKSRGADPERVKVGWKPPAKASAVVITDPDLNAGFVQLGMLQENADDGGVQRFADSVTLQLALQAMSRRIDRDIKSGTAQFNGVGPSDLAFARPMSAPAVYIDAANKDVAGAYAALLDEFARVRQFGFKDREVAAVVETFRDGAQSAFDGSETVPDADYATGYVGNFLSGTPVPSAKQRYDVSTAVADGLDATALTTAFNRWFEASTRTLVIGAKDGTTGLPSTDDVTRELAGLDARKVEDRPDLAEAGKGFMEPPVVKDQGKVSQYESTAKTSLDTVKIDFANGARVLITPTTIVDDAISIYAVSPGGLDAVADKDVAEVWLLNEVNTSSGLGDLDANQAEAIRSSAQMEMTPYPSDVTDYFIGGSTRADFEIALQQMHQYMVASKFEKTAFDNAMQRNYSYVDDIAGDPDRAVAIEYDTLRNGGDARTRGTLLKADLDSVSLADMPALWTSRFGNASDFTFIIVGDVDVKATVDLARTYIGTLPGTGTTEKSVPLPRPIPSGVQRSTVKAGTGNTAGLTVRYTTAGPSTGKDDVLAGMLEQVLNTRLTKYIREELGASYSPRAFVNVAGAPISETVVGFYISGAPDNMDKVAEALQTNVADLLANGAKPDEFEAAKAEVTKQYGFTSNQEIIDVLAASLTNPAAVGDFVDRVDVAEKLTAADVDAFAKKVIPADNYIQIIQLPR